MSFNWKGVGDFFTGNKYDWDGLGDGTSTFDPSYSDFYDQGGWTETIIGPDMSEEVYRGTVGDDRWTSDFRSGLDFLKDFTGSSSSDREPTNLDTVKEKLGLPTDKPKNSWYSHVPGTNVGFYGGSGYGSGLPAIQAAQSLGAMYPQMSQKSPGLKDYIGAGMRMAGQQLANKALYAINPIAGAVHQFYPGGIPEAFKDVTRFAGGIGNTVAKGVSGVVKGGIDFVKGLFCDERLKVDIAPLESTEVNDELAQMAFFVKGLRECS